MQSEITKLLIADFQRRLIDESLPRIIKCLDLLSDNHIWYQPNESTNSVGNLIMHLIGNVRQYIHSGLAGYPDNRKRNIEFTSKVEQSKSELIKKLTATLDEVKNITNRITDEDLIRVRPVQCFSENGVSILMHVAEHFSYHTGQIVYFTKWITNQKTEFYAGMNLDGNEERQTE